MKQIIRGIIYFVLFSILIGAFIYLGEKDFKNETVLTDQERFAQEYEIDKDNVFEYIYAKSVIDILNNKTGIIFLGFSSNDWSKYYVKYLNEVIKENNVKKVYYYDLQKDRTKNNKYYRQIETKLSDYLYELDTGVVRLSTPALIIVKNGNIMYFDDETSIERNNITPDYYWNEEKVNNFKSRISSYIKEVNINE